MVSPIGKHSADFKRLAPLLLASLTSSAECSLPQPPAVHPESPLIQFLLPRITSAIPSNAPATPNPGDPWVGGWSVDEGSEAVRVGDAAQYIISLQAWIQQLIAGTRLLCTQVAALVRGIAAGGGYNYINIISCYLLNRT